MLTENDDRTLADQIFGTQAVSDGAQTTQIGQTTQNQAPAAGNPENGEEPEGKEPEKKPENQEPELLAGKYKTPEELERAYIEGQKWWTRSSQEVGQLKRDLEDLQKQVAPDMTKRQEADFKKQMQQAINKAVVDEDPEALIQMIQDLAEQRAEAKVQERYQGVDPLVEQNKLIKEVNDWISENPEAAEHLPEMQKLLDADPDMVKKPGWLDRAYVKAVGRKFNLTRQARSTATAQTQAEKAAASIVGSTARPQQETETEEQKIVKGIFGDPGQERGIFDD